jgi:hypothetical protein
MSGAAAREQIYAAIEESAGLLGVPCARERVWPILTAYGDGLTDASIIFSVSTGSREFDYTIQVPAGIDDPYAHALANGFVTATDHPVGALLSDVRNRAAVSEYFFDCGVVGGFQKLYASFPHDLQPISTVAGIPSLPAAVAENAGFFDRHGLVDVTLIGVDYQRRTMNVYFQLPAGVAGDLAPEAVRSMLHTAGMAEPDEQMLELACHAYRIYVTFGWDSSRIARISFAPQPRQGLDLSAIQPRLEPEVKQFMGGTPYVYGGERVSISVPKWTAEGSHFNLGSYYQISPQLMAFIAGRTEADQPRSPGQKGPNP